MPPAPSATVALSSPRCHSHDQPFRVLQDVNSPPVLHAKPWEKPGKGVISCARGRRDSDVGWGRVGAAGTTGWAKALAGLGHRRQGRADCHTGSCHGEGRVREGERYAGVARTPLRPESSHSRYHGQGPAPPSHSAGTDMGMDLSTCSRW